MSNSAYAWTKNQLPAPTRASGFDAGTGGSDAKKQIERLKADNADLTKMLMGLKSEMRDLVESLKPAEKKGKKNEKPGVSDQVE